MSNNPAISIVIPVYNGQNFLYKTLGSIEKQTFRDFEVICVDDMSTDNSLQILNEFASRDTRFKVLSRSDKGGCAVKGIIYAMPHCNGEYYFFCSQDDWISYDCLEKVYNRAIETGADTVLPDMKWYYEDEEDHGGIYPPNEDYDTELTPQEAFVKSLYWNIHGFSLRKMDKLKSLGFDDRYFNSCEYMGRLYYLNSNKVVFSKGTFYYRQDNKDAITKSVSYLTFGELGTNVRLLNLLIDNKIDKKITRRYLRKTTNSIKYWKRIFDENVANFSAEKSEYIKNIIEDAKNDIWELSLKNRYYINILRMLLAGYRNSRGGK